mmetsp:Transcript_54471/g.88318  ORF Transcript_54471/g.88318 Transcript_54471/m.88318 type:complete len:275 (-) Transcript_54471:1129-1953(-)
MRLFALLLSVLVGAASFVIVPTRGGIYSPNRALLQTCRHQHGPIPKAQPVLRMVGKDAQKNEPFEVTWEHEDGTTDTTIAEPIASTTGDPIRATNEGPITKWDRIRYSGAVQKIQGFFSNLFGGGVKLDKQALAALGASALLSYGFVSNLSHLTCLIISWCVHGKKTGLSPLDPGQWPAFLAVYAVFFAFQNVIRPVRFAVSVALSPFFDRVVDSVQAKGSQILGRPLAKPTAFGVTVFLVNVLGSFSYLFGGLIVATTFMRVPLLATKAVTGV